MATLELWPALFFVMKTIIWNTEKRKISELKPAEYNPREMTDKQAKDLTVSLERFDLADPIVINTDNTIIGGHQRIKILTDVGRNEVDVRVPSRKLSLKEEQELNLRLNRNLGQWDYDALANFDQEMLLDVGFESAELDKVFQIEPEPKDDEVPAVPEEPKTKVGDIYILGNHRVMCGDSTKVDDVEKLMGGKKADMVFTDPPYGIEAVQNNSIGGDKSFGKDVGGNIVKSNTYSKIIGDDTTNTAKDFYNMCVSLNIKNIILWGGNYFTDFLSPSRCWIVWDKEMTGNFSEAEMAWTSFSKGGVKVFKHLWNGLSREGNRKEELKTRVHPTQKPVGLFAEIFKRFDGFKSIYDGFLGSGSTLIACEKTNRICYGMELDPKYCDVIVKRWEEYTGKKAELVRPE